MVSTRQLVVMGVLIVGLTIASYVFVPFNKNRIINPVQECADKTSSMERGQAIMMCQDEICGINRDTIRNQPNGALLDVQKETFDCLDEVERLI